MWVKVTVWVKLIISLVKLTVGMKQVGVLRPVNRCGYIRAIGMKLVVW